MKKLIIALALAGLLAGPTAGLEAKKHKHYSSKAERKAKKKWKKERAQAIEEDLTVVRKNQMDDFALTAGQTVVGLGALGSMGATGFFGNVTYKSMQRGRADAPLIGTVTALGATTSAALTYFWHKLLEKRAKRHGGEKSLLKFYVTDWFSRYPRFILKAILSR